MNTYEQLLLNDKAELESKIAFLVEEQLNNNCPQEKGLLSAISTVINFSYEIKETCSFDMNCQSVTGQKLFSSIEEYIERDHHYESAEEAEQDEVEWDEEFDLCGSFGWDNNPTVIVKIEGLTQLASIEAQGIWAAQTKDQNNQKQLRLKRQKLEQLYKTLHALQGEIATYEATQYLDQATRVH